MLEKLAGSKWFTVIDLKCGYWQIKLSKDSCQKVAFSTPDGHYEFVRMPIGLKNAPAEFCRIMHGLLGFLDFVEIYIYVIIIHSKTFEEHMRHIEIVLEKLNKANLKINPLKCKWCASKIKVLGHVIMFNKIMMDPDKISAIVDMKSPRNIKELQRFLGLCNFYRSFIENFSE